MKCVCKQCGTTFELSESEIAFYRKKNLNLPKRCKECRQENKEKQEKSVMKQDALNGADEQKTVSGRGGNRKSKWVFALTLIAAIALLVVGGVKFARAAFVPIDTGTADTAVSLQNDISDSAVGQREKVDVVETSQSDMSGSINAGQREKTDAAETSQGNKIDSTKTVEYEDPAALETATAELKKLKQQADAAISEASQSDNADSAQTPTGTSSRQYVFKNEERLNEHYQKHGIEMGFATAEEYQAAASAVVNNANALHKSEAEDNDDIYYLQETNELVIVSTSGYIRTYFSPNDGIEYYNRQ